MSDTESKQSKQESAAKNDVSESNAKSTNDNELTNMSSSTAHNTYANLICREDAKNKKTIPYSNQEMKDISQLRRYRKGETTYDNPPPEINSRKKIFATPKDLVKKNLDDSKVEYLQKGKYI